MNTKQLKSIAILSMVFDHVIALFPLENLLFPLAIDLEMIFPQYSEIIVTFFMDMLPMALPFIGRLAAPIFMFCITIGYFHTSNLKKYISRIFLLAILSQVPYILFNQAPYRISGIELTPFYEVPLNILFTLGTGLLSLYFFEKLKVKNIVLALFPVVFAAVLARFIRMEGREAYILIIFMFHILRDVSRSKQIINWIPILLLARWDLKGYNLLLNTLGAYLGICITLFYNGEKGNISKQLQYGMYWFYPAHLLLLAIIGFVY